jgi:aminobenzoyl-glutamate utilization protein B
MTGPDVKETAWAWIDANWRRLSQFHLDIWRFAEPAFREYKSARAYCDLLRAEGFDVEEGSGGMPTAFAARFGEGRPVLGSFAEYDAVPENSQQPVPYPAPRAGLHPAAAGHTDPHSALGVAALAGILGAREAMRRHNLPGTLRLFGEPAEKVCGSKPVHAAKGYYDGADAFVVFHPRSINSIAWETLCGAYWSAVFSFECPAPETWIERPLLPGPRHPHADARCPGALDAACLMYTMTKYLKEAMVPHTGMWTLNEFMMVGGQCTADNLSPRIAQLQYAWRSPTLDIQDQIHRVLERNGRGAAEAAHCDLNFRWITKTRIGLPNLSLAELVYRNLEMVGPPAFDDRARQFARDVQRHLGLEEMPDPFADSCQRLQPPEDAEAELRRGLPEWQRHFSSDDYVEYTWHAPTARLFCGRPTLRPPRSGYEYPAWAVNALGGVPACIDPMTRVAGKTIAASLVDLLTRPETLAAAKAEFDDRTGGGIGGTRWVAPLLSPDFAAPTDLRWPEYVVTPRGEEWWIPTPRRERPDGARG